MRINTLAAAAAFLSILTLGATVNAQTTATDTSYDTTGTTSTTGTTNPGVPNTGAGGNADANLMISAPQRRSQSQAQRFSCGGSGGWDGKGIMTCLVHE